MLKTEDAWLLVVGQPSALGEDVSTACGSGEPSDLDGFFASVVMLFSRASEEKENTS